jgi:hypothetical protein
VLDRERVLGKPDALHGYERELRAVLPANLDEYTASVEKAASYRASLAGVG